VAVERDGQLCMDFPQDFILTSDDAVYLCGTAAAFKRYYDEFPRSQG
jgi:hypothetical protein